MQKLHFLKNTVFMAGVAGLLLLGEPHAQASLIVAAPSITAAPGNFGNFDVVLQNTGGSAVGIGGFSFGITTTNPGITFTAVNTSTTAVYIFAGLSTFGPDISVATGTTLTASDSPTTLPTPVLVASGATVGLGNVTYNIANNVTIGNFEITLIAYPATSLVNGTGSINIPIDTLQNGSIQVVPEPGTLLLFPTALGMILLTRRKDWRRQS